MKKELIAEIERQMLPYLNNEQLQKLQDVLNVALHGVTIAEAAEETVDTDSAVTAFIAAKRVEGCSEKTLEYYRKTIEAMIGGIGKTVQQITTDDLRRYLTNYQSERKSGRVTIDNIRRISPIRKEIIEVCGKKYEASYFGEANMTLWSKDYTKRAYWRLENAYPDFCEYPSGSVLPYNNYPPIGIQTRDVFLIEYTKKSDGGCERKLYRADGTVWKGMPCTVELAIEFAMPLSVCSIRIGEKTYDAPYYGEVDISSWSAVYEKRSFYRLQDAYEDLLRFGFMGDVLPYNNYPNFPIEQGDAFLIDYFRKDNGARERWVFLADGTVWNGMICTHRVRVPEELICG